MMMALSASKLLLLTKSDGGSFGADTPGRVGAGAWTKERTEGWQCVFVDGMRVRQTGAGRGRESRPVAAQVSSMCRTPHTSPQSQRCRVAESMESVPTLKRDRRDPASVTPQISSIDVAGELSDRKMVGRARGRRPLGATRQSPMC